MSKNEDDVELTHLKKSGKDSWNFQIKPNASFDRVFESLLKAHVFDALMVYSYDGRCHYSTNDQGIWLLSHCFSNWTEMYQKATQKSPWEEQWQKKQGQEEEDINASTQSNFNLYFQLYKNGIINEAEFKAKAFGQKTEQGEPEPEKKCAACGVDGFNDLVFCRECGDSGRWLCSPCYANPTHIHSPAYKEKEEWRKQRAYTNYRCKECGAITSEEMITCWHCSVCHEYYCKVCRMTHTHVYDRRREYGFTMNVDDKAFQEMLNNLYEQVSSAYGVPPGMFERAEEAARATAERMRKEQEAKDKARAEREKRQQEEFFRNFWNAGRYDPFGNESHTGQQSYSNSQQSQQRTRTQAPSSELEKAFKLLNLSQRATVQEVKRAFYRMAKQGEYRHPDVGGEHAKFVKLNNAYELALQHAERNER